MPTLYVVWLLLLMTALAHLVAWSEKSYVEHRARCASVSGIFLMMLGESIPLAAVSFVTQEACVATNHAVSSSSLAR